jgi:transglutaminase-like putative cysteine protease
MALAVAAAEMALAEPDALPWVTLAQAAGWLAFLAAAAWYVGRLAARSLHSGRKPPPAAAVFLLVLLVLPLGDKLVRGQFLGEGSPLEILLLACLRNLGVGLAALAVWTLCLRLAALVSLFLMLVASSLAAGALVVALLGAYAAAGCLWLMLAYWSGLRWHLPATSGPRFSVAAVVLVLAVAGSVAAAVRVAPSSRLVATLLELMPSSGGTLWYQSSSRGGVNDGDDEIAGDENARSVGFSDSNAFLDSPKPSLYDIFNDFYGKPLRMKDQDRQRALALEPNLKRREQHAAAENLRPGRDFATVRQTPNRRPDPHDRDAHALLYIQGKTPLHLRLTAYDTFDGVTWSEAPFTTLSCILMKDLDRRWLRLGATSSPIYSGAESHQVKVGLLDTQTLPVPAHLRRFRMGRLNQVDFFGWAQDGILRMAERTIPASTTIMTEAYTADPRRLREVQFVSAPLHVPGRYLNPYEGKTIHPGVAALAREWADDIPRGWTQIEAIVARLRGRCVHDREARAPVECRDVVAHFLLESRRGPDYVFASAAAVLLRSLDYPTRLVSGFYVSPERYDRRTRHTPVQPEDAHFWTEVLLPSNIWVAIEATPGYELMAPALPWTEQLAAWVTAAWEWARDHVGELSGGLLILALLYRRRREIFDRLATLWWWITTGGGWRLRVLRTVRLVEHRARWAGRPRPPGQTLRRWYAVAARGAPKELEVELVRLLALADRATHAPAAGRDCGEAEVHVVCQRVVRHWTLRRFRSVARSVQGRLV